MRQIDYNLPIFLYTFGLSGMSNEKADSRMRRIKESFEPLNMNVIFIEDISSSSDKMSCLWHGSPAPQVALPYEMEF
jgi:hypothetical protein